MGRLTAARVRALRSPGKYHDQHGLILGVAPGGVQAVGVAGHGPGPAP